MQKSFTPKILATLWLTLFFFLNTALAGQNAELPLQLKGNWFLQSNTNEWKTGFYDKLVYFNNDFWQYKIVEKKEKNIQLMLQKGNINFLLPVNIISDSTIQITYRDTTFLLTNKRRRMAAGDREDLLHPPKAGKDSVWIKGYVDHRYLVDQKLIEFRVDNLVSGSETVQVASVDKDGQFSTSLPLRFPSSEVIMEFGGVFEYILMRPGDTAIVYIDLSPYLDAKAADDVRNTDCNMVIAGAMGAFNNEYRDYRRYAKKWDDHEERYTMIRTCNEDGYREYELERKRTADSLLADYEARYTVSNVLRETMQQRNKYLLASSLYRYRWLHEPDKKVSLSPGYLELLSSFVADDQKAHLAGLDFGLFIREAVDMMLIDRMSDRRKLESVITANASLEKFVECIRKNDRSLTENLLKSLDTLKQLSPAFVVSMGRFSFRFSLKDSAEARRFMQRDTAFIQYMDDSDCWFYYYSGLELLHGLSLVDSLFPKGPFRDYVLGRYIYPYFLKGNRLILDDDMLSRLKTMCSDPATYAIITYENVQVKRRLEEEYEDLLSSASSPGGETVLNKVARQNKGKVIYVDYWATSCGPCIEQFPYSRALQQHFEGKPVVFVYLCADSREREWQSVIKNHGLSGQHILLTSEESARLRSKYNFSGYPRYMIINKDGRLVTSNSIRPQSKEALAATFEYLLE